MSRDQRLPIPANLNPPLDLCIQLQVPHDSEHLAILYGLINEACRWSSWDRDDMESGKALAALYNRILATAKLCETGAPVFGEVDLDMLIRQNPDNPCVIETSANGTDWCTLFDLSLCQNFGTQPGPGSPQPPPGGGNAQYCAVLNANGMLLLPTVVSTGDVITLESAAGSGWDGGEFDFGPLYRCPDGEQFVAGACIGFKTTKSGDPLPAVPHMSLIVNIAGTFYDLSTPLTVPSGVSNQQAFIQVNDDAIANNQGSYQVCAKVTNNKAPTFTHTFEFADTPGRFVLVNTPIAYTWGNYVPGSGWEATDGCDESNFARRAVYITRVFPATVIDNIACTYSATKGADPEGDDRIQLIGAPGSHTIQDTSIDGSHRILNYAVGGVSLNTITIFGCVDLSASTDCSLAGFSGFMQLESLTVKGRGVDPF